MIILDFIMANEDHHLVNFGVIRDVESLQWVAICPIFDTGRSLNNKYWLDEIVDMRFFTNHFHTLLIRYFLPVLPTLRLITSSAYLIPFPL